MIELRKITPDEYDIITEIWLETSIIAHDFINNQFWIDNKETMKNEYLPSSDVFIILKDKTIAGFIAIINQYIAALFIAPKFQSNGLGTILLNHVKKINSLLNLKVFKKNKKSISFYLKNDFKIIREKTDQKTNEKEIEMLWIK